MIKTALPMQGAQVLEGRWQPVCQFPTASSFSVLIIKPRALLFFSVEGKGETRKLATVSETLLFPYFNLPIPTTMTTNRIYQHCTKCWRRKWQPIPTFLPGKSHGQRSLAGYSSWGHTSQTQLSPCTRTKCIKCCPY